MGKERQERPHSVWFHLYEITRVGKSNGGRKQISIFQGLGKLRSVEKLFHGSRASFGVMKMIWRQIEIIIAQHYECTKCH